MKRLCTGAALASAALAACRPDMAAKNPPEPLLVEAEPTPVDEPGPGPGPAQAIAAPRKPRRDVADARAKGDAPFAAGAYKRCRIADGQVRSCEGASFQGSAAVMTDGSYHACRIAGGQVSSCDGAWFHGSAIVRRDGAYRACRIVHGQVHSCEGVAFEGDAVVFTSK